LPRLCGFPSAGCVGSRLKLPIHPLVELHLPLECHPATPTRPVTTGRALSWAFAPYSTYGIEDPLHTGLPTRYGPPSGFGYPLDGFRPAIPCRFYFTPAALMGLTLRRFPLPEGIACVSARKNPRTVGLSVIPTPKRRAGPIDLGFWALALPGVPCDRQVFKPTATGASLGFHPSRVNQRKLWPRFPPASSHALGRCSGEPPHPRTPQSVDQPSLGPTQRCAGAQAGKATLIGFLHRTHPDHSSLPPPGLCVHLSSGRALLPERRGSLGDRPPYRSCPGSA